MDPNQLTDVLNNCQSPDINVRTMAEKWLAEAEKQNLALFLQILCAELANNDKPAQTRRLAGLIIKNSLTAKDEARKQVLVTKWLQQVDPNIKTQIKQAVLMTLASPVREARATAAQVISKIAHIEVPKGLWNDLVQILLNNMQQESEFLRQATLETLGYICEEIEPDILKAQANAILTAVCKGIKDKNPELKIAGLHAMYNALEFVKANFEKENERNYIMQVLCESAVFQDVKVRVASLECLVKVAQQYYDKLTAYMQKIFNITLEAIKKDDEQVAQQAIEFWSTICDEEIYLQEEAEEEEYKNQPQKQCQNFIRAALKYLVPLLTECLTKQEDEPDEDTWNVAMAAGTCLSLVAAAVGDEVVAYVMPFVTQNINNQNWKFREAATLAFGAILEGPKGYIGQLITQAIPVLLNHMKSDPVVYVKDTTAWTIGRVCQLHPQSVQGCLQDMIAMFLFSLQDNPRVASNICWAIHNLALSYDEDQEKPSSALSPYFQHLAEKLLWTTDREDADENNLRSSAYEALNILIQSGAKDTYTTIGNILPLLIEKLARTFAMQIVSQDDREEQVELQSLLCSVLQMITQKLGENIKPVADRMMQLFLQVFNAKSASVHEEALMAIGAIANAVEGDFDKYMNHFRPYLTLGLRNYEDHQVCAVAVGVVGDISRALGTKILPYCDEIVSLLLQDLQNPLLNRNVKPPILSCFGDLSLAIGGEFVKYLGIVMNMLQQASTTTVDMNDYDLVDYLNQLREGIFEAYTGIIQGLRSDNMADPHLLPYVAHIVHFVGFVFNDASRTEAVTRGAVGVLGDLAHSLGPHVKAQLGQPFVRELLSECMKSDVQQTVDVANWAKEVISAL